jgi:predicted PurR-regulated permease PerM
VSCVPHGMRIDAMLCPIKRRGSCVGSEGPVRPRHNRAVPHGPAMEPMCPLPVNAAQLQSAERGGATKNCALAQGRIFVRVLPGDRQLPKEKDQEARRESKSRSKNGLKNGAKIGEPQHAAQQEHHRENGAPMPESAAELPPLIRRQEVVAIALVGLLVIAITTVLYFGKAFFLPVVMAFVVGTMLSPAASLLERWRVPRGIGAVLIVLAVTALGTFIVGLIASPAIEWSSRLPELAGQMKDKLHIFDRPLALWHELQVSLGGSDALASSLQMPKFEWVQPTLEFLSPTFTEFLLFFVTLVLFIASWKELRRALIMNFGDRVSRLRTLRILNEIEEQLGSYLLTVTLINAGVGIATGIICVIAGMPNPAGLGALAATLNYVPIIGPVAMFAVLIVVGMVALPTLSGALVAPMLFVALTFFEGHFITPTIIGRKLALNALAVLLALAFWTWLWGPMGGFLSSPLLIVALILKEHLMPVEMPQLPED